MLLGHPLIVSAEVKHGDKRGRLIGFPTANMETETHKLLPANGVYAVRVHIHDNYASDADPSSPVYIGAANIGTRPTFDEKKPLVEVHLLDVDLDLYGKELTVEFLARLRSEQRFSGIDALKTQIAQDVQQIRQIVQN